MLFDFLFEGADLLLQTGLHAADGLNNLFGCPAKLGLFHAVVFTLQIAFQCVEPGKQGVEVFDVGRRRLPLPGFFVEDAVDAGSG